MKQSKITSTQTELLFSFYFNICQSIGKLCFFFTGNMYHNHSRHSKKPSPSPTSEHIFIDWNKHTIHLLFRQLPKENHHQPLHLQVLFYELRTFQCILHNDISETHGFQRTICNLWFRVHMYLRLMSQLTIFNMYNLYLHWQDFFRDKYNDNIEWNHCKVNINFQIKLQTKSWQTWCND